LAKRELAQKAIAAGKQAMNAIKSIVKNGQINLCVPAEWPEGAEVLIRLVPTPTEHGNHETDGLTGMTEEEQGDDRDSILRWLAEFDAIPPLQMTPAEEAAWQAARQSQRAFELATFNQRAEQLQRMWE
jgi:hypothetical protein